MIASTFKKVAKHMNEPKRSKTEGQTKISGDPGRKKQKQKGKDTKWTVMPPTLRLH